MFMENMVLEMLILCIHDDMRDMSGHDNMLDTRVRLLYTTLFYLFISFEASNSSHCFRFLLFFIFLYFIFMGFVASFLSVYLLRTLFFFLH